MWDSFLAQTADFAAARSNGDVLGLAAAVAQMLILLLEMLGISYLLYALGRILARSIWIWSKPTLTRRVVGALVTVGMVTLAAYLWVPHLSFIGSSALPGVRTFEVTKRDHVKTPLTYPQTPPVGGNHAPVWQNCGFYDTPIADENAVHSLEHGAVWIAYRPDLTGAQVDSLRRLAQRQNYILASPYPDLTAPVVASAWGHQLRLRGAEDPRLNEFVRAFRLGPQTPELGAPCTGGKGTPE
jgi:hypothetical protein